MVTCHIVGGHFVLVGFINDFDSSAFLYCLLERKKTGLTNQNKQLSNDLETFEISVR